MSARKTKPKAAAPGARRATEPGAESRAAATARPDARTGTRSGGRLADAVTALEREREDLRKELVEARARIAELEKARKEALDRIDWAIDSLQNILQRTD